MSQHPSTRSTAVLVALLGIFGGLDLRGPEFTPAASDLTSVLVSVDVAGPGPGNSDTYCGRNARSAKGALLHVTRGACCSFHNYTTRAALFETRLASCQALHSSLCEKCDEKCDEKKVLF